jgi:hypothetical protein
MGLPECSCSPGRVRLARADGAVPIRAHILLYFTPSKLPEKDGSLKFGLNST